MICKISSITYAQYTIDNYILKLFTWICEKNYKRYDSFSLKPSSKTYFQIRFVFDTYIHRYVYKTTNTEDSYFEIALKMVIQMKNN